MNTTAAGVDGDTGRPARRRIVRAAIVVAIAVLVASCSIISNLLSTEKALTDAGYGHPSINFSDNNSYTTLDVTVDRSSIVGTSSSDASTSVAAAQQEGAAHVIWTNFPYRFDALDVTVRSVGSTTFTYDNLLQRFGSRPASLDAATLTSSLMGTAKALLIGAVAFIVLLGAAVTLVIVLVMRSRRRKRAATGWGAGLPPTGFGIPPYGGAPFGVPPSGVPPYGTPGAPYGTPSPPYGTPGAPHGSPAGGTGSGLPPSGADPPAGVAE